MSENPFNPIVEHLKYAEDMIRLLPMSEEYYRGLVGTVLSLLAQLRTSSDMEIFLQTVMKACCDFYQADWAGILVTDATSGMWTVDARYDVKHGAMAETDIGEDECFEDFPLWAEALTTGKPIFLNDIDPSQNGQYSRFHAKDLIGFPYLFRPTGFIVIRNPQRYKNKTDLLHIITSVGEIFYSKPDMRIATKANRTKPKITFNILGTPSITIAGRTISSNDYRSPICWKTLSYLSLHREPITAADLAAKIGISEKNNSPSGSMRTNIHRIREKISRTAPADIILSDNMHGYFLNPDYVITSDAQEMERLWKESLNASNSSDELSLLKMAFTLYKGDFCSGIETNTNDYGNDFDWLNSARIHYRQIYHQVCNALMERLAEAGDYSTMWDCLNMANSAINNKTSDWYCWMIFIQLKLSGKPVAQERYAEVQSALLAVEVDALDKHLHEVMEKYR